MKTTNQPHTSGCSLDIVLCVTGTVLMRSTSVAVKALGASLTTFSMLRLIKKLSTLAG
ncbi:hypothetical protein [Dickeya zeae]|uniref:hypothetical protein n=1 Tax=Dickeya zeae TaxID=204042 RepID=UPI001F202362|nr:hypothetical protein [Dickeya zeae]UJR63000.1 hypothetical protein HJ586_12755 [Dickeya zeae]